MTENAKNDEHQRYTFLSALASSRQAGAKTDMNAQKMQTILQVCAITEQGGIRDHEVRVTPGRLLGTQCWCVNLPVLSVHTSLRPQLHTWT